MVKLTKEQAKVLKSSGYTFTQHHLYQDERFMVMVDARAYQLNLNGKPVVVQDVIRMLEK